MNDELLAWREQFPALNDCVHLISHSLGCIPLRAAHDLAEYVELWDTRSVTAWDEWLPEIDRAAARIERLLSAPGGTVTMHTNVSMVQAIIASCLDYTPERNKVVYSDLEFPSCSYVWKAEERRGAKVHVLRTDGKTVDADALCALIDERTVAVPISHVTYGSSFVNDVAKICRKARSVGAHVILDCYHSLGVVPVDVVALGVSFACGGSVKFLCGGPGAAYLYVRKDLIQQLEPRVTGWFANEMPFAFTMPEQTYAESIWRFQGGTPAVPGLYQSRAGAEIIGQIGVSAIREKSLRQTQIAIELVDACKFRLRSPREAERRGGVVVFDFVGAAEVVRELSRRRFFCDHRPGAGVRIGPHFYNSDDEILAFFHELQQIRG
ncbi:MAG TPA: aminotransferase class V-fold PLP-dependent enzyme [Haliangium sp.]|nr:aminotransferase class V-fold PLP-dependent enzyme [Haliangium sp.]